MIELYSHNLLVLENGQRTSLSADDIRRDLLACSTAVGIREPWLADHLVLAVEEFVLSRAEETPVWRHELDQLLIRLLVQAGYADVAAEYAKRRRVPPLAGGVGTTDLGMPELWTPVRVAAVLEKHFPLLGNDLATVCSRVTGKLGLLGFSGVTDRLILELGSLVLREQTEHLPHERIATDPWLISPADCGGILRGIEPDERRQAIYSLRPISRLLPAVSLTLHMNQLGSVFDGQATEMAIWPEVRKVSSQARLALSVLRDRACRAGGHEGHLPPRLTIDGVAGLVDNLCAPMSRAKARRIVREIVEAVRVDAVAGLGFPVLVQVLPH